MYRHTSNERTNRETGKIGRAYLFIALPMGPLVLASPAYAQPGFSLTVNPGSVYVNQHGKAESTITVLPADGFTGYVTLRVSQLPRGVTAAFHPRNTTSTSELVFTAAKDASTGVASVRVIGHQGGLTRVAKISLAVSAATGTGGAGVPVDLSAAYNVYGIYTDGTIYSTGGLDGPDGNSYSANLLMPTRITYGYQFNFGPANQPNAVSGTGQTILLPVGQFTKLSMLATGVNGNQPSQIVTLTYTDGSTAQVTQSFSDWYTPQGYPGETEAVVMPYRNEADGIRDNRTFYLYGYSFSLDSSKTIQTLTLPDNRNLVVLGLTLH